MDWNPGTTSNSNTEILQRYQSKTLRLITNASWYVNNRCMHNDLNISIIIQEINNFSLKYFQRLSDYFNLLAITLLDDSEEIWRLKRFHILNLPF